MTLKNFSLPPDTRVTGQGNPAADMDAVIDAITAMGVTGNVLNTAYAGGADPTGVADSTAAIQAATTAAISAGAPLYVPAGTYSISTALNWKATGLRVIGAGKDATKIIQTTANTPVAQVAGGQQEIAHLTLGYASQRPSSETNSICLTFGDDTVGSCFDSSFHDLFLEYGATGMAINPAVNVVAGLFSCTLTDIRVLGYSYSAIRLIGSNGNGANCTGCVFTNIYTHNNATGSNATCAYYPVMLEYWDEVEFNQLNVEHGNVTPYDVVALVSVTNCVINGFHSEELNITGSGTALFYLSSATKLILNGGTSRFNVFGTSGSDNPVFRFFGAGAQLIVHGLTMSSNTITATTHELLAFGSATNVRAWITGADVSEVTALRTGGDATSASLTINGTPGGKLGPPAVSANGAAYTNAYQVNAMVYVTAGAGAVTVAVGGNTMGTVPASGCTGFSVPAGQTITLTYSTAPTWAWYGI